MVQQWARQLGRGLKKTFGRQLSNSFMKFGRQLSRGVKLLPGAFKDTSRVYSDLERKTQGVPVVSDMFGFASKGTGAIGNLLSGNFSKAYQEGKGAVSKGKDVLVGGEKLAGKAEKLGAQASALGAQASALGFI